jgi:hypothetical protein
MVYKIKKKRREFFRFVAGFRIFPYKESKAAEVSLPVA